MSGGGGGTAAGTGKTTSPQNYRSDRLGLTCSSAVAETAEPAKPTGSRMGKRSYLFSAAGKFLAFYGENKIEN
jgi:hypothetical protein